MPQDPPDGQPQVSSPAAQVRARLAEEPAHLPPHIPDHELLRRIGRGSYGDVWLARNVMGRLRAVKIVHRAHFDRERPYEREYAGIQKFEPVSRSHEGFVDILQVGRNDAEGYFYYVMELADSVISNQCSVIRDQSLEVARASSSARPLNTDLLITDYSPRTLRSEIQRRGRLPVDECIALGLSLARALAHLHAQGLVHRDIKPSNIIFVGRVPKLADIGLVTDVGEARSYVGTEGFIPPEGPGTPAADLFSLGKVLYEASTGKDRQDFPEPLTTLGEQPDKERLLELNAILHRACQSDPRERYRSAEEMVADLELLQRGGSVKRKRVVERRWALAAKCSVATTTLMLFGAGLWLVANRLTLSTPQRSSASAEVTSIAVLPFVNENTNYTPHEYLCDALTVEAMNALTNCAGLRVASRPAVFAFKRATNDVRQIGAQLGVRSLLAGSFLRNSNEIRLTARLVSVSDGTEVWSTNFTRPRTEFDQLGADLIRPLARVLGFVVHDSDLNLARTNLTRKLAAYRSYNDGIQVRYTSEETINKSIALLSRAVVEDPDFGEAYAALAHAYVESAGWLLPPANAIAAAKVNAQRAMQLDDSLALAHIVLGNVIGYHEMDFAKAERELRRALELDPRSAPAHVYCAGLLTTLGRFEEAAQLLEQGEQIAPKAQVIHGGWCSHYYHSRRFEEAIRAATNYLAVLPNHQTVGVIWLGQAQERLRRYDDALASARRLKELSPDLATVAFLGLVHARLGHRDEAERSLEELRVMAQSRGGSAQYSAKVLFALGDKAAAIKLLQQAVSEYPPNLLRLQLDPYWDDLRADPECQALFKGAGLELQFPSQAR